MARFSGKIGYSTTMETKPGVWTDVIIERQYYGDLTRHSRKWGSADAIVENITFSQDISIVADPYLYENFHNIRYVTYRGIKWKVTSIEIDRPRVRLTTGEEYHGN